MDLHIEYEEFRNFAEKSKEKKEGGPMGERSGYFLVLSKEEDLLGLMFRIMLLAL